MKMLTLLLVDIKRLHHGCETGGNCNTTYEYKCVNSSFKDLIFKTLIYYKTSI